VSGPTLCHTQWSVVVIVLSVKVGTGWLAVVGLSVSPDTHKSGGAGLSVDLSTEWVVAICLNVEADTR
jgi:hypothetical protein